MLPGTTSADAKITELEAALEKERTRAAALEKERDALRASHERLRLELELMRRRMFVAKAERVEVAQLKLDFAEKLRALDAVAGTLGMAVRGEEVSNGAAGGRGGKKHPRPSACRIRDRTSTLSMAWAR